MPDGEEFVDLGPWFNSLILHHIERGVADANRRIAAAEDYREPVSLRRGRVGRGAQNHPSRSEVLAEALEPRQVAKRVRRSLPDAVLLIEALERELRHGDTADEAQADGRIAAHFAPYDDCVFTGANFIIDPRNLSRVFRSSTVQMYGTYLGTDKLGHFVDMGHHYHRHYLNARDDGHDESDARAAAVRVGSRDILMGESGLLGFGTNGGYSNADLASNYAGLLFYINLTEPITIGEQTWPAICTLGQDNRWHVRRDVATDPNFFARYISDHWNEALNPSLYMGDMRGRIRDNVRDRAGHLYAWYAAEGRPASPRYFTDLQRQLSTWHGENYGHRGTDDNLVHLGNTPPPHLTAEDPRTAER
jgi:hypothetical protein